MQRTSFNSVVIDSHEASLWFWSFGLNIIHGLTLKFDPKHPPGRQMVILMVPAEGRLMKVSSLCGSHDDWALELGLDREHLKPKAMPHLPMFIL